MLDTNMNKSVSNVIKRSTNGEIRQSGCIDDNDSGRGSGKKGAQDADLDSRTWKHRRAGRVFGRTVLPVSRAKKGE